MLTLSFSVVLSGAHFHFALSLFAYTVLHQIPCSAACCVLYSALLFLLATALLRVKIRPQ
jgi:hypothetical protein